MRPREEASLTKGRRPGLETCDLKEPTKKSPPANLKNDQMRQVSHTSGYLITGTLRS